MSQYRLYFRIFSYTKPYSYVPYYVIFSLLGIVFGAVNFTLLKPVFDVLFGEVVSPEELTKPELSFSIIYLKDLFYYNMRLIHAEQGPQSSLRFVCTLIVISVLFSNLFRYLAIRIVNAVRIRGVYRLREQLFEHVLNLHNAYFTNERKGDLIARFSNDVLDVERFVLNSFKTIFREPATVIIYFGVLFYMSWELTLFTVFFLPASGLLISRISKNLKKKGNEIQNLGGVLLEAIEETLSGLKIIKSFTASDFMTARFEHINKAYADTFNKIDNRRELAGPLSEFLGVSVVAGILLYGGSMVLREGASLSAATFITYVIFFSQVLEPMKKLSSALSNIQRGLAAAERVFEVIDTVPLVTDTAKAERLEDFEREIEFRNVSFAYGEKEVLKNISFTVKKGETVALVGPSGGGKSTLADLIPRFYDPLNGEVFLDGKDVREYRLENLRSLIGIVTQESVLFNDTVARNIAFGNKDFDLEEVKKAAKIANADEFISENESGYEMNIGDRGAKLSGGQRQRLSIARAVMKNPPILILDEATSALDSESEHLVQEALDKVMKDRTSVVIAHRLSTIQNADKIVVIREGEVVEMGTHAQLLTKGGLYKKLTDMQGFA